MSEYEVQVDRKKCIGAGFCEKLAPQLFKLDENNRSTIKGGNGKGDVLSLAIGPAQLEECVEAAKVCPSYAIEVINRNTGKSVLGIEPGKEIPVRKIKARYESRKEWVMDTLGFFTIKPFLMKALFVSATTTQSTSWLLK